MLDRLERKLGKYALPNLTLYLVVGQLFTWAWTWVQPAVINQLTYVPAKVLEGEVWRLLSFGVLRIGGGTLFDNVWVLLGIFVTYILGRALDEHLGEFRYNLFVLLGWVASLAAACLAPHQEATNFYFFASFLLGFAYVHPDYEFLIFLILPVKVKWFALLTLVGFAALVVLGLLQGDLLPLALVGAGVGNVLVFFGRDMLVRVRGGTRRAARRVAVERAASQPTHTCTTCGKTDLDDASLSFRYCSKCEGAHAYCTAHLKDHPHVR